LGIGGIIAIDEIATMVERSPLLMFSVALPMNVSGKSATSAITTSAGKCLNIIFHPSRSQTESSSVGVELV